jgi:hypothetical protein
LGNAFIDLGMKTIVAGISLTQRRCEQAIDQMKATGFMEVRPLRFKATEGKYLGFRATRIITPRFFEWLSLGAMLAWEWARGLKSFGAKFSKLSLNLSDIVRRQTRQIIQPVQEKGQAASHTGRWLGRMCFCAGLSCTIHSTPNR